MAKGIVRITNGLMDEMFPIIKISGLEAVDPQEVVKKLLLPPETIGEKLSDKTHFHFDQTLLRIFHPDIPDVPKGYRLPWVVPMYMEMDGEAFFAGWTFDDPVSPTTYPAIEQLFAIPSEN